MDRWNPAYFERLRRFCREAERRGVIVELVMFSPMYSDERWRFSPLHLDNNLQGEAWRGAQFTSFIRGESKTLLDRQKAMVRKIVTELRDTPNVYFEIANEPAARLIDSEDGRAIQTDSVDNPGGAPVKLRLSPEHTADIALRIGNKR